MEKKNRCGCLSVLSVLGLLLFPPLASPQANFFQGKTITMIRGSTPGGVGERRARALMPYLTKHIPGNPNVMMEFMAGAGGRKAANL